MNSLTLIYSLHTRYIPAVNCGQHQTVIKGKSQFHARSGHEGPEGKYRYSSTLSLISALDWGGWSKPAPAASPPRNGPSTHFIGGCVGPRAGPDGCRKSHPHRDSIPGPSRYTDWAIPAHRQAKLQQYNR